MTTAVGHDRTKRAYAQRASEYVSLLGASDQMDPLDACVIGTWSDGVTGSVLDAGCGPGHWSDFLRVRGSTVHGVDAVPQFVESARSRFPSVTFEVGDVLDLPFEESTFGGVRAWYSLIHLESAQCARARGVRQGHHGRWARPDRSLPRTTWRALRPRRHAGLLPGREGTGSPGRNCWFNVLTTHTRTSLSGRPRPHLAVAARKSPSDRQVSR